MSASSSVLVTGGAGYIGSHAVKALRRQGATVVRYDNLSAGHEDATAHASVLVNGDIHDTDLLRKTMREQRVDAVMHRIRTDLGWSPRFEETDVIVDTAWRWRNAHPHGYPKATS